MKILLLTAVCGTILAMAGKAFSGEQAEKSTRIVLTINDRTFPAVIIDNAAGRDLLAKLPLDLSLNRGGRDYCGDVPALRYDESDVQNGYQNGDLAYWIPGQDFVVFLEKEETSQSVSGVVVLGKVEADVASLMNLGPSVRVRLERAN